MLTVRIRPSAPAGVAQWESRRTVGVRRAFDSLHRLQRSNFEPRKHCWRCAAPVKRGSEFDSGAGLHPGKAQLVEHSIDNREAAGSSPASRTRFTAEKMSWRTRRSHKPPLGRVRFPPPQPWGYRSTAGLLVCTQPMRVRFSPSPPDSPA